MDDCRKRATRGLWCLAHYNQRKAAAYPPERPTKLVRWVTQDRPRDESQSKYPTVIIDG